MNGIFTSLINMSISASILVGVVLVLRILLKNVPKWIFILLWGMVAFRLVCPITFESSVSLMPEKEWVTIDTEVSVMSSLPENQDYFVPTATHPDIKLPDYVNTAPITEAEKSVAWADVLPYIWLSGVAAMLIYALASFIRLYRQVSDGVRLHDRVYQSEKVTSAFVLGFFKPRIFIPYSLKAESLEYVIAHETAHIRRHDHWWKPIGYLLLAMHWFNPVMWLAYIILCRDIESACDEKVVRDMNISERADYSEALLDCSVKTRRISACPLAFGESGVKSRIKSVLSYKKPAFWVIIIALVLCVGLAVLFLTSPESTKADGSEKTLADRIIERDGYCVIEQRYVDISIGIHTARIMGAVTGDAEFEFEAGQRPAYLGDGVQIYLKRVEQVNGDRSKLRLTFDFEYYLDENGGTLLAPWTITDNDTYLTTFNVPDRTLYGAPSDYQNALLTAGQGPDSEISVYVLKEALHKTGDDGTFLITLNQLTYLKDYERRVLREDELMDDARLVASVKKHELEEAGDIKLHTEDKLEIQFESVDGIHAVSVVYSKEDDGWILDENPIKEYSVKEDNSSIHQNFPELPDYAVYFASNIGGAVFDEDRTFGDTSNSGRITVLEKIDTGTVGLTEEIELYYMEYVVARGIDFDRAEEKITYPLYFALYSTWEEEAPIEYLGAVTQEEFINNYNTTVMKSRYGSPYTALATELYQKYMYSGESGVSATQSMEDKLLDAYDVATTASSWFNICTLAPRSYDDSVELNGMVYGKTPYFETYAEFREYLEGLFSKTIVDGYLSGDSYIDYNGKLYSVDRARGSSIDMGYESYTVNRISENKYELIVTVEVVDEMTVVGYEELTYDYEKTEKGWVFTSFPSVR